MDKKMLNRQVEFREIVPFLAVILLGGYAVFPWLMYTSSRGYDDVWNWYIYVASLLLIIAGAIVLIRRKRLPLILHSNRALLLFGVFIGWMILSTACNDWMNERLDIALRYETETACYVTFFVLTLLLPTAKQRIILLKIFLCTNTVIAFIITARFYKTPNYDYSDGLRNLYDIFYNANHLGYYLLMGTVVAGAAFLLAKPLRERILLGIMMVIEVSALIISDTLGCMLALITTLVFIPIVFHLCKRFEWKKYTLLLMILLVTIVVMCFLPNKAFIRNVLSGNATDIAADLDAANDFENAADSLGSGRMNLWKTAIRCIGEKPILGRGIQNMRDSLLEVDSRNASVHNEFLEIAGIYGIPALLLYLAAIMTMFFRGLKNRQSLTVVNLIGLCGAFAYLVSSFFGVALFYTAPYMFIFLGLGYYREAEKPTEVSEG